METTQFAWRWSVQCLPSELPILTRIAEETPVDISVRSNVQTLHSDEGPVGEELLNYEVVLEATGRDVAKAIEVLASIQQTLATLRQ